MKSIVISPVAQHQLDGIYEFTLGRWGPSQADAYTNGIIDLFEQIAMDRIQSRPIGAVFGVAGYVCRYESHYIYWQPDAGELLIVAILHRRMEQTRQLRGATDAS